MAELLLLVTGAGASRNLGVGETRMPLMADWSDALCAALDDEQAGLAAASLLEPGMKGSEFESNLGLLLKFGQMLPLVDRFGRLGMENLRDQRPAVEQARQFVSERMTVIKRAIDTTLYDQFGLARVDDEKAIAAYEELLRPFGKKEIVLATTNYDRAGESALAALGFQVDTGFRGTHGRTPQLDPVGLIAGRGERTPVIHLHGAVGWYEKEGAVEDHYADKPYNNSLGSPVVLYPDPEKDPTKDSAVSQLWTEFDFAVEEAEVVVVMGHSLHDSGLVRVLKTASKDRPVVITYFDKADKQRIEAEVPNAQALHLDFGPKLRSPDALKKLLI